MEDPTAKVLGKPEKKRKEKKRISDFPNDRVPSPEEYQRKYTNKEFEAIGPVFTAHIYAVFSKKVNGRCEPEPIRTKLQEVFGHQDALIDLADDAYMAHRGF
jgi:hypothetical protein